MARWRDTLMRFVGTEGLFFGRLVILGLVVLAVVLLGLCRPAPR